MNLWHLTSDTARIPYRVRHNEPVQLHVGTWPIEPGQRVWLEFDVTPLSGPVRTGRADATWTANCGVNSYWSATIGPFQSGDHVRYSIFGTSTEEQVSYPVQEFQVQPKLHLAIIWHQHQPIYKDGARRERRGSYVEPWVRLHTLRDYYSMAELVRQHPSVHLTINLTPSLLSQIEDYVRNGATDRALELTLKPAERLNAIEREYVLSNFFDAHWHNQIFPHPRYKALFERRYNGQQFTAQDIRDLQMWFNLAWFAKEFRECEVRLVTGEVVSVRKFIEKQCDFDEADISEMVESQYKILGAVIPLHRQMQDDGQIEISTTPFFHPILPLLVDTDRATIDRPGAKLPLRFAWPEDAEAQVRLAVDTYSQQFGRPPRGMWPAEGAVSQSIIPLFAQHDIRWIASDEGVLASSGQYGYRTEDPNVLCQPYRAEEEGHQISILFRNRSLSDTIGFDYHGYADYNDAAADFISRVRQNFSEIVHGDSDHILTIILDGENAWGDYREDARPFLSSLYSLLEAASDIQCVTPSEFLAAHGIHEQTKVYELFTGSWIDRWGSRPGVDLDTWIGEPEKNEAWELLAAVRRDIARASDNSNQIAALRSLYTAEGSDWFWWFGSDHDSGHDESFDDLFRTHLKSAYAAIGKIAPSILDRHITPHSVTWTFSNQITSAQSADRITIRTNCPGVLLWHLDDLMETYQQPLNPAGGAMAAVQFYQLTIGPFALASKRITFHFQCTHEPCSCKEICCEGRPFVIAISSATEPILTDMAEKEQGYAQSKS
jgi:alpha-amylase/alpha-mannosidase (GH57 family)